MTRRKIWASVALALALVGCEASSSQPPATRAATPPEVSARPRAGVRLEARATFAVGPAPRGLAVLPDGVAVAVGGADEVVVLDADGRVRRRIDVGGTPSAIVATREGDRLLVLVSDQLVVVSAAQGKVVARVEVGGEPSAVTATEPGRAAVADALTGDVVTVDTVTGRVLGRIGAASGASSIAFDAARRLLWVADAAAGEVVAVDPAAGEVTARVARPASVMAVDERNGTVYAASGEDGTLIAIDAETAEVRASLVVGGEPSALAVDPARNLVFVLDDPSGIEGHVAEGRLLLVDGALKTIIDVVGIRAGSSAVAYDESRQRALVAETSEDAIHAVGVAPR